VLSTTLLANVPELGTVTHRQIAALADVAPLHRDCGTLHGKRMVGGERAQIRATGYNPRNKTCYQRLCGLGKTKKKALIQASDALANGTVSTAMTVKTVADPAIHGVVLPGSRDAEQPCGQLDRPTRLFGHRPDSHPHTICIVLLRCSC